MNELLIKDISIVNENEVFTGSVFIKNEIIQKIFSAQSSLPNEISENCKLIDGKGKYLLPGIIDDQVHFREPGLTHKADIYSESKAAVAGGVTSFLEMPNTIPQTIHSNEINKKIELACQKSLANFAFYLGATNDNIEEIKRADYRKICGIKVFMGSSTGNMLVDNEKSLSAIFSEAPALIAVHAEDETIIKTNYKKLKQQYGSAFPDHIHMLIRDETACYKSSEKAIKLATKYGSRLHVLHLTTAKEMDLFSNNLPVQEKKITAEVCVHHLYFNEKDYKTLGHLIKCNPAIKNETDRLALWLAINENKIDVIASDHAPHTISEKQNNYEKSPAGIPMVQHILPVMLNFAAENQTTLNQIVNKMCHAPAHIFNIKNRGFIRKGYYADLVIIDNKASETVGKHNILYKGQWSPLEQKRFTGKVITTIINGKIVFDKGVFNEAKKGIPLVFNR